MIMSLIQRVRWDKYVECVLTLAHIEEDQTSTERPVLVDQKEEHEID